MGASRDRPDDVIFVTIDCWRHDAPSAMDEFSQLAAGWDAGTMMTTAAPTNGVFPSIFASQYYPDVYDDDGLVKRGIRTLPDVLADEGYETAGFVASNPYAGKWSDHFDTFWNDGIEVTESGIHGSGPPSVTDRLRNILLLREKIPAENVFERADDWWQRTAPPRFLWIHLMDLHQPYKPGLQRGREYGLLRTYAALVGADKFEERIDGSARARKQLKELYYTCGERLDPVLSDWLATYTDSATIVVTGDHGEEFDHGMVGHARLYDEVVTIPIYSNARGLLPESGVMRQLDLAPSIAAQYDAAVPDQWEGQHWHGELPPQPMVTSAPQLETAWLGIRSEEWKLIERYDWSDGFTDAEAYHVAKDPDEETRLPPDDAPGALQERLDRFGSRRSIRSELRGGVETEFGDDVKSRLRDLGYVE